MPQNRGSRFNNQKRKEKAKDNANTLEDDKNPVVQAFRAYARELDDKHDRHERIVKLSRDITIESKRIIFLLHTIDGRKHNRAKVLEEAEQRLNKLIAENFKMVAKELAGRDPYQFRWAYSPGLQEFIEAYTFMEYMKSLSDEDLDTAVAISDWNDLQKKMQYAEESVDSDEPTAAKEAVEDAVEPRSSEEGEEGAEKPTFEFFVDPTEYILGVCDLTGELMRRCINSLGSGETDVCHSACKVLQQLYTGYVSLNVQRSRELSRKIYTMRQSTLKAESVCYNVKVRGGEAAKWGAVFDSKPADDVDEGFF